MNTLLCDYESEGNEGGRTKYRCSQCGHERFSRHPAHRLHRRCGNPLAARERLEADILTDVLAPNTRTMHQISQTLDKCLADCRHMGRDYYCTLRGVQGPCREQEQWWIEFLLESDCDQFAK